MKQVFILVIMLISCGAIAQTRIEKSIPVKDAKKIELNFDFPNLIRISTWESKEISIVGTVSINHGLNDEAFKLFITERDGFVSIENKIDDMKGMEEVIVGRRGGEKFIFRSKDELRKYKNENPGAFDVISYGMDIEIELEIKVPVSMTTQIDAKYGMVEVVNFNAPLTVMATYGGVDVSLNETAVGQLIAETNYGQIYSNLKTQFTGDHPERDFHTVVSAQPGTGPKYQVESTYGNVYLRRSP